MSDGLVVDNPLFAKGADIETQDTSLESLPEQKKSYKKKLYAILIGIAVVAAAVAGAIIGLQPFDDKAPELVDDGTERATPPAILQQDVTPIDLTKSVYTTMQYVTADQAGTVIQNKVFEAGLFIQGANNVEFKGCTFRNPVGWGVRFSDLDAAHSTTGVKFTDCTFHTSKYDNLLIDRVDHDQGSHVDNVLHQNVVIKGCTFSNWSSVSHEPERRWYHAIYSKCPNVRITESTFILSKDGAGHMVSLRSSAIVDRNLFKYTAHGGPPISYTPKPLTGGPEMGWDYVLVENNLMYSNRISTGWNGAIFIESQAGHRVAEAFVEKVIIRFNTIAILQHRETEGLVFYGIKVTDKVEPIDTNIYGNLIVDSRDDRGPSVYIGWQAQIDRSANNVGTTDMSGTFVNPWYSGRDFHLKPGSKAINAVKNEPFPIPELDFDGKVRTGTVDAGCFDYQ